MIKKDTALEELPLEGLTTQEAIDRRHRGQGNNVKLETGRSYWQIIHENIFTFINIVFFAISVVMISLQLYGDGVLVVVVIFGGVIINIFQELWAKQQLDEIALLHRPRAIVFREGIEQEIEPGEIVLGDLLVALPGEQILVDGQVVGTGRMEVDESLLTGESELILKLAPEPVYSGTFCVSGRSLYRATKVGKDTTAYELTVSARAFRQVHTPLQVEINLIIRVVMLIACFLWILSGVSMFSQSRTLIDFIHRAAVIAGLVPVGMYLAITLAYALGAVRMIGQDVLIQQANAVESLSNVDVLCLDKTGTLTSNNLRLQSLYPLNNPLGIPETELQTMLANYGAEVTTTNKTTEAIVLWSKSPLIQSSIQSNIQNRNQNLGIYAESGEAIAKPQIILHEVPFTSSRKWSALTLESNSGNAQEKVTYVLGAPEMMAASIPDFEQYSDYLHSQTIQGLRVLMFAITSEVVMEVSREAAIATTAPILPSHLTPLGILTFRDELRPQVQETLAGFRSAGIELKIISGDNPETVVALAKQAGVAEEIQGISGAELALMDEGEFRQAALENNVFGRITPEQKAKLVQTLRRCGRYVAMIGDGVNDVLSLKQANLGIAMESGAKATRGVADIVLLQDSFGALPFTFLEGQKIRNGIIDVVKLFLVRSLSMTMMIFASAIVADHFPFVNKHTAIVSLIGVGFPTMFIPLWAKPGVPKWRSLIRNLLHFVLPATLSLTCVGMVVYLFYLAPTMANSPRAIPLDQISYDIPRSALVTVLIFCQLLLIPFLKPPVRLLVGGEALEGDWRYTFVALGLFLLYGLILLIPASREFFNLALLQPKDYLFLGLIALEWGLILRLFWRTRSLDRFLGVDLS